MYNGAVFLQKKKLKRIKPTSKNQDIKEVFDWISGQKACHIRLSRLLNGMKTSEKSEGIVWYSDNESIVWGVPFTTSSK